MCSAAIKTPYLPNGKFDLEAYDAMVEQQIQVGAVALLAAHPVQVPCAGLPSEALLAPQCCSTAWRA